MKRPLDAKRREHLDAPVVHPNGDVDIDAALGLFEQVEFAVGQLCDFRDAVEFDVTHLTEGLRAGVPEFGIHSDTCERTPSEPTNNPLTSA
jgi:hypothetical protein